MRIKNQVLALFCVLSSSTISIGQINQVQKISLKDVDFHEHKFDPRKPRFLKIGSNPIINYNPISLTFSGALYFYQKVISPQLQSHCPYEISCSAFSFASIKEFGLIKGVALSADRLTRCTPYTNMDMMPSQRNERTGMIIDNPSKYSVKGGHEGHDHK
jgi:putative component of membrane protein insertase Oxa1/YidC/SpoIIIJ protein YidD